MTDIIYQTTSAEFAEKAEGFFKGKRETKVNDLPTVSLLLFLDPGTKNYVWYAIAEKDKLESVVEYSMAKKGLIPVGACLLAFESFDNGTRIRLTNDLQHFVEDIEFLDVEEVLNGTIPHFMWDTFGYELGQIKISDLTKN